MDNNSALNNPLRDRDHRPEFLGKLITSTEPLDKDERLFAYKVRKAIDEFFNSDQAIEEEQS